MKRAITQSGTLRAGMTSQKTQLKAEPSSTKQEEEPSTSCIFLKIKQQACDCWPSFHFL